MIKMIRGHGLFDILDITSWIVSGMTLVILGGELGEFDVEEGVFILLSLLVLLALEHCEVQTLQ